MKNQDLPVSQVVVCKIHQSPLFVTQALLSAISFHLPRVILAIFLPIVRVRLAPLPRTFQAHLPVYRIGSDLLPMIIAAALALACGVTANLLLRMIRGRLQDLPTVPATTTLHHAAPDENGKSSFSLEAPFRRHDYAVQYRLESRVIFRQGIGIGVW